MSRKKRRTHWRRKQRTDKYFRRAKEEGYRARSAYKLKQIQQKYHIISRGDTVIDLGAAPGGWSQVVAQIVGKDGRVVAIDIAAMEEIPGVTVLQADITAPELGERLSELEVLPAQVIISDAAPAVSGIKLHDHVRSIELGEAALRCAREWLVPGGHLVIKVFEGEDFPALLNEIKRHFKLVKGYTPDASRRESKEVYIVAKSLNS